MDGYKATLLAQNYHALRADLSTYRIDPFIRDREAQDGPDKGLIFPFARGLRFSALLIYQIREALSGTGLHVNWGQLIDDDGYACSGECDIIIYQNGHYRKWNGGDGGNHIMDFRFIEKENAIAVISCKSHLTKSGIEEVYCQRMLKYVGRVWLFAECCGPDSVAAIDEAARAIGYEHFWHLYTWSRTNNDTVDALDRWMNFISTVKALVK